MDEPDARRTGRAPIRLTPVPPGGARTASELAGPSRTRAALELAGAVARRPGLAGRAGTAGSPQRRPPPLDYRRTEDAPPPAASAAPAAPPAAAAPAAAVVDIDALSRDVIDRIEKRLRIERERHGRG